MSRTYNVIGLMSGSSLDGLDLLAVKLDCLSGGWSYVITGAVTIPYDMELRSDLLSANQFMAKELCILDNRYGHYLGRQVNKFIKDGRLSGPIDVIASHGHTIFHDPEKGFTTQIGSGAAIAAETGLSVVTQLRDMDVALGGQGAPLVPLGEKLLFPGYQFFLNLGGIANISYHGKEAVLGYDICPANRVLNGLAAETGAIFDKDGEGARRGSVCQGLLEDLDSQAYYSLRPPKSLDNSFGAIKLLHIIQDYRISVEDKLRTFVEHIGNQVRKEVHRLRDEKGQNETVLKMLTTGGGALNKFLMSILKEKLKEEQVEVVIPERQIIEFKEALIMALLGALRLEKKAVTLISVTGAERPGIGGALWEGGLPYE